MAGENGEQHENGASQSDAHDGNNDGTGDNTDPEDEDNTATGGNESTGRTSPTTGANRNAGANASEAGDHRDDHSELTDNGSSHQGPRTRSKRNQPAGGTSEPPPQDSNPSKRQRLQRSRMGVHHIVLMVAKVLMVFSG